MLKSAYEVNQDLKHRLTHQISPTQMEECINSLFPDSKILLKTNERLTTLEDHIVKYFESLQTEEYPSVKKPYPVDYSLDYKSGLFLYALCKIIKPEKVVETGVAYGRSSAYILQALHENQKGKLYSIDYVFRPWQTKQMIGSAIPNYLKDRWELTFGPSSENLSDLLDSLGEVDIFIHDSLHTFKTMTFEYQESWPHIRQKGFLISDDAASNNAFYDFGLLHNTKPLYLSQDVGTDSVMGIIQKQ